VERIVCVRKQPLTVERLEIGFVACPFFGNNPTPTFCSRRIFADLHRHLGCDCRKRGIIAIRYDISRQSP